MNICLFTKNELEHPLAIHDERAEHIIKVLHKKAGGTFTAGIIGGESGVATITAIDGDGVHFTFASTGEGKPLLPLVLVVGFPRPIQLRRLLRDGASLGAMEVHLTGTALGEKSYMQSSMLARGTAEKMLIDGAAQAGSTHAPKLFLHHTLNECLDSINADNNAMLSGQTIKIALDNVCPVIPLVNYLNLLSASPCPSSPVRYVAAIGAERGWTDDERVALTHDGWTLCSMGCRILRTETAVTAASSIILAEMGLME